MGPAEKELTMHVTVDVANLPSSEELLIENRDTAPLAQISQEPLQGAAYRLRAAE
jgi:hypothetical protein